jgi:hypothetical protein
MQKAVGQYLPRGGNQIIKIPANKDELEKLL